MLSNGDTLGVFQLESPGMKNLFRKIGIKKFKNVDIKILREII